MNPHSLLFSIKITHLFVRFTTLFVFLYMYIVRLKYGNVAFVMLWPHALAARCHFSNLRFPATVRIGIRPTRQKYRPIQLNTRQV